MTALRRLALTLLLASCAWDLEPPEGPRFVDASTSADVVVACGAIGAACSSTSQCCGRLSCRARIAAAPRCCLEANQPCTAGNDPCCGGMSCVDLGNGGRCICGQRGIQCVTDADCCAGLRCVLRFPTNPGSGGDCM